MKLSDVKKLHQKKYRTQFGYYLVEGEHLILELNKAAKNQSQLQNATLYVTDEYAEWTKQLNSSFTLVNVTQKQMVQMSNTETPQGIIACVPMPQASDNQTEKQSENQQTERAIYLHEIQDPGNLGTILRSLAWFGNFRLLLSDNSVDPFNPKVVRSSMGAIFHVPLELGVKLTDLPKRFKKFAYLDLQGDKISDQTFSNYDCYLFGNEARGVPHQALSAFDATAYTIEGKGEIDSLNVASAVNICVYQLSL
ncbi:TrmH family RNA methyltransferase [Paraglaciecola sp.]|uniref:TrmH family RNA methyltransferase n=1 Tax=Paraglaciecola sp. TaxID=1920173 RepID=UPI003EF6BB88